MASIVKKWWQKRKKRKELERAVERGKTEDVSATRIITPSGKTGTETKVFSPSTTTPSTPVSNGGGRSSGGGGSSSSRTSTAIIPTQAAVSAATVEGRDKLQESFKTSRKETIAQKFGLGVNRSISAAEMMQTRDKFGRTASFYEESRQRAIINKAESDFKKYREKLIKELQEKIKKSKISVEDAERVLNSKENVKIKQLRKEAEKKIQGKTTKSTTGTVSARQGFKKRQVIAKLDQKITDELNKLETESFRISPTSSRRFIIGALTALLSVASGVTSTVRGVSQLPKAIFMVIKNPSLLKQLPKETQRSFRTNAQRLKISPTRSLVKIGTEVFLMAGTGKVLKTVGKVKTGTVAKLSPRFRGIKNNRITIKFPKTGKKVEFEFGTIGTTKEPVSKQLRFAGTKQPVVTTAQANRIISLAKRKRTIRKPIPNEASLSKRAKSLLKKFDDNKISTKEFKELELIIQNKLGKSLLERSLYVDPLGRLRASRLGVGVEENIATLRDLLKGNFSLRANKPQIIFFRDVTVEAFPKTAKFKVIIKKLKANKPLNSNEIAELVRFQVKKSGKFKPVGSTTFQGGIEPELTLAPGEIIKRVGNRGFTIIKGKRIPIVEAKVIKGTNKLNKLLDDFKLKKITKKDLADLKKIYKKETNVKFDTRQARNLNKRPLFRPKITRKAVKVQKISRIIKRTKKTRKTMPRKIKRTVTRKASPKKIVRKVSPRKTAPRKTVPRKAIPRKVPTKTKGRAGVPKRPVKPKITRKVKPKVIIRKAQIGYNAFALHRGKYIKLNKKPLSKANAQNRAAYVVDNSISARGRIKAVGKVKKLGKITPKEKSANSKIKSRKYRIVKGKRVYLKNKIIEKKGKPRLNTRGEKKGITAAKLKKKLQGRKKK